MKLGLILIQSGLSMTKEVGEVSSPGMGGQVPQGGEGCLNTGEEETEKKKMRSQLLEIPWGSWLLQMNSPQWGVDL